MSIKYSLSFLATDLKQLPKPDTYGNEAVEAVIFNRSELDEENWKQIWNSIKIASDFYGASNVTFHFPVNDSDYVNDAFVFDKLCEAYKRAIDMGIHGVVVHSNRIRKISEWQVINLEEERRKVIDTLCKIVNPKESTWLALENMPVMDNYGKEIDPLFSYPLDFISVLNTPLGIVWDTCHYTNTITNIKEVVSGKQSRSDYPNIQNSTYLEFGRLKSKICHWHFSAFKGIANSTTGSICREGVLPTEGTLDENIYRDTFSELLKISLPDSHIVFEVQEQDYYARRVAPKMISWAKKVADSMIEVAK